MTIRVSVLGWSVVSGLAPFTSLVVIIVIVIKFIIIIIIIMIVIKIITTIRPHAFSIDSSLAHGTHAEISPQTVTLMCTVEAYFCHSVLCNFRITRLCTQEIIIYLRFNAHTRSKNSYMCTS